AAVAAAIAGGATPTATTMPCFAGIAAVGPGAGTRCRNNQNVIKRERAVVLDCADCRPTRGRRIRAVAAIIANTSFCAGLSSAAPWLSVTPIKPGVAVGAAHALWAGAVPLDLQMGKSNGGTRVDYD